MMNIITFAQLTVHEARRRKVVAAGLLFGLAFLALYATSMVLINQQLSKTQTEFIFPQITRGVAGSRQLGLSIVHELFTMAGLYAVNFLIVMMSVLMPIDTLSGEIASGAIQSLVVKPVRRADVLLGKWLGFWLLSSSYLLLMCGGVLVTVWLVMGFSLENVWQGLAIMLLESTALLSISIAGGTRLTTLANGVMCFGLFGLAFIGGWVEQIGALTNIDAAKNVGVVTSLIVPSEAMWRLAAYYMQSPLMREVTIGPFSSASVPSNTMIGWTAGYIILLLLVAIRSFSRRDL